MLDYHASRCDAGVSPATAVKDLLAWAERRNHTITPRSITTTRWSLSWDPRVANGHVGAICVTCRRTGVTIPLDGGASRLVELVAVLLGGDPPGARATRWRDAATRWRNLATHDTLTGLPNRLALTLDWPRLAPLADGLLMVDIDRFKTVNDTHGHATGDALLVHLARALTGHERIHPYRLAGDEFAILASHDADPIVSLVQATNAPIVLGDATITTSVSVGILLRPDTRTASLTEALRLADMAMYAAKRVPRGDPSGCAVRHWTPELAVPEPDAPRRRQIRDAPC